VTQQPIRSALLSVADKTGIVELAQFLYAQQIRLLSTGGTAQLLKEHGVPVIEVSDYTGFPEIMDGRVKTLHPKIHAGLLGRSKQDAAIMTEHKIDSIDLLVVNLYPFAQVTAAENCNLATAIENIDVGGPAMLRAAAKNYAHVAILSDPQDYPAFIKELAQNKITTTPEKRLALAQKAFTYTANYDTCIANYLRAQSASKNTENFPDIYQAHYQKKQDLPYGENPHQTAAFYIETKPPRGCVASSIQIQGKALSYNNIVDADAALECVKQFTDKSRALSQSAPTICAIVKHANPCGVALASSQDLAYQRAFATDPSSAYGGIIAFNQSLEAKTAAAIIAQQFVEVIIAPDVDEAAIELLKAKPNIRVLKSGYWNAGFQSSSLHCKQITGGLLLQERDDDNLDIHLLPSKTPRTATLEEYSDLAFAWKVAKSVKSNAIVFAKMGSTLGIGAGQMSRIDSTKIALRKAKEAGLSTQGAIMASDAFFPFADSIEMAAEAGITAIIQPGGSMRDEEVIAAAAAANIAMVFTNLRHFWH